jgi:hypothetical protein
MSSQQQIETGNSETVRRLLVGLVFISYWLTIFEGALRKWAFPEYGTVIYFLKDPFVLITYILACKYRMWPKQDLLIVASWSIAGLYLILACLQVVLIDSNPLIVAYGLRNYFWYIPLAFIIGENFRGKDLARLMRETLFVAIPIAGLVYFQFKSPPSHWINRYVDQYREPHLIGEAVRTCGTFSFLTGQTTFVASLIPIVLTVWLLPRLQRPIGYVPSIIATLAVVINIALNGSRAILFYAATSLAAACVYIVYVSKKVNFTRSFLGFASLLLICGGGVVLMNNLFPEALESQSKRLKGSSEGVAADVVQRASPLFLLETTLSAISEAPILGYGIGVGSSGATVILSGQKTESVSEGEWPKIIEEGGFTGISYILYRLLFCGWVIVGAFKAVSRTTNPLPILLLGFLVPFFPFSQLVMGGTPTFYGWMFAGLGLAANQLGVREN